ncbi:hypothetical protein C4U11_17965 [Clostridioides difficile]|nr:hypothetical protein [Clostridioides difficile]MDB0453473.1 hypothetical protein [Clostridioides difficile]MDB2735696.1 hypothetical protein [Clostridioides difficile]MDB2742291.1 hypothetical protein [Clostridioides difficile]MDB3253032.1 hypothetical protein [Clostridioides difficile]
MKLIFIKRDFIFLNNHLYTVLLFFYLFIIYFLIKVFLYSYFLYYFTFNFIRIIKNKIVIRKK